MWIHLKLKNDLTSAELIAQLRGQAGVYITHVGEEKETDIGEHMNIETDFSEEDMISFKILIKPQIDG